MSAMSVLFVGGSGIISTECVRRSLEVGHEVTVLNRGRSLLRQVPAGAEVLVGDIRDPSGAGAALAGRDFDVVCQFVAFTPDQVAADVERFGGRVRQYVFVSSASAYQKPVGRVPIVESTPLRNPFWQYSRDKIACEDLLVGRYREDGFPVTIVRPSHTYDATSVPLTGGWTTVERMRRGLPVVVHGDGTSRWHLTHSVDFAHGFVGLLGHPQAIGEAFHITGEEALTWDHIYRELAAAAGNPEPELVHVASDAIASVVPEWGPGLVGDKAHTILFDNAKIRAVVPDFVARIPFSAGAREIVAWHDADPDRRATDPRSEEATEAILRRFG